MGERARTRRLLLVAEPAPAGGGDPLLAAARAVTEGTPGDPDHRTLWGGRIVTSVELVGSGDAEVFSVRLVDDSTNTAPPGMTPCEAELAIQQVVWSLQSAGGAAAPVAFHVGESTQPFESLLGVPATGPGGTYVAADGDDVLNHVAVLAPAEGAAVTGEVELSGVAESFEGTVGIHVRDAAGRLVLRDGTTADQCCFRLWPWRYVLDTRGWAPGRTSSRPGPTTRWASPTAATARRSTPGPSWWAEDAGPVTQITSQDTNWRARLPALRASD